MEGPNWVTWYLNTMWETMSEGSQDNPRLGRHREDSLLGGRDTFLLLRGTSGYENL